MKQIIQIFLITAGISEAVFAAEIGQQVESVPIRYGPNQHEKELFGYNPAFTPSLITFDPQNRPYIREWGGKGNRCPDIQTLDQTGTWVNRGFKRFLPEGAVPGYWTGTSDYGTVIDKDGDLYVLADAAGQPDGHWYLMHSRDQGQTWTPYKLPFGPMPGEYKGRTLDGNRALLQPNVRSGFLEYPPVVLGSDESRLLMVLPEKKDDGTLSIPPAVQVEDISGDLDVKFDASWKSGWGGIGHGGQKKVASFGEHLFIAWSRPEAVPGHQGTPMYIAHYNRKEKRFMGGPRFFASNGVEVDSHNQPIIGVDHDGYIHALLGSHGTIENNYETVTYVRSEAPLDISSFTDPVRLPTSGCTYPALVIDSENTLHVVCRKYETYAQVTPETFTHGYVYQNRKPGDYSQEFPLYPRCQLAYFKKRAGADWSYQPLVVSYFGSYVYWHNRISLDVNDRVFVSYRYGPHIDELVSRPVAPALLFSGDHGETWKLAVTKDLLPVPSGYQSE